MNSKTCCTDNEFEGSLYRHNEFEGSLYGHSEFESYKFLQLSSLFSVSVMFLQFCRGLEIVGVIGFKLVPPMVLNACKKTNKHIYGAGSSY